MEKDKKKKPRQNIHYQEIFKKISKILSAHSFHIILVAGLISAFIIGGFFEKLKTQAIEANISSDINTEQISENLTELKKEINGIKTFKNPPPVLGAKAYGIYYPKDGNYSKLHTKDAEIPLPPASVTKIMTAIIALEKYDLDKPVVIPQKCVGINGSNVGFKANEVFTLEDLLFGLLVKSGADAACAIANISNEYDFIQSMNEKAKELNMDKTTFANEIGFDANTSHLSTVSDIQKLTEAGLKFSTFRKIVGTKEVQIVSISTPSNTYRIRNTNDLLFSIPGTIGIKTGYTELARECLTFLYENRGKEILVIILGSEDRFGDTTKLLEWAKLELTDSE